MPDNGVIRLLKRKHNVFAKLSPIQKARIIRLLKTSGNVVGYMGDGINDTPSLTNSDVGVSVDTAVDIAKETADIILLEKDLNVLLDGVTEGRKTFSNLLKYIKLAVSFNFGEVISVLIASILLPFFPITPIQLLVQSLLYDIGQLTLPFDNVDSDALKKPRKWSTSLPGISKKVGRDRGRFVQRNCYSAFCRNTNRCPQDRTCRTGRACTWRECFRKCKISFKLKERYI